MASDDSQGNYGVDDDSTLGDEQSGNTASITSDVYDYVKENGRTYQNEIYFLPNDEDEKDRLDAHHCVLGVFHEIWEEQGFSGLHRAPISKPQSILDLATGTGIWAIEMGDMYPSAHIIGNDISPTQPNNVPVNVHFEINDIEQDWSYPNLKFDYIHCRGLAGSIKSWSVLIRRAFEHLNPGGWFEFSNVDWNAYTRSDNISDDDYYSKWANLVEKGIRKRGMEPCPYGDLKDWMTNAGFTNIQDYCLPIPLGPWEKDTKLKRIGLHNLSQFNQGLKGFSLRPLASQKWSSLEIDVLCANVKRQIEDDSSRIQHGYYVFCGQKPRAT